MSKSNATEIAAHAKGKKEIWRDVVGYEGLYQVSSWGRVKSLPRILWRMNHHFPGIRGQWTKRINKGRFLKQIETRRGDLLVRLCKGDGGRNEFVHRLVLLAFVGPCPKGMETCHWDGKCWHNWIENLRWGTKEDNGRDNARNGIRKGEKHPLAKLNNDKVREIRRLWNTGEYSRVRLGGMFGVTAAMIWCVVTNKSWTHI